MPGTRSRTLRYSAEKNKKGEPRNDDPNNPPQFLPTRAKEHFMKRVLSLLTSLAILSLVFILASSREKFQVSAADNAIVSRDAEVEGVKLHYMTAGHGPAVILLHGYAETSLMWKPIIPLLAERFTVIAPDLPVIGDSAIPVDGLDMKTAAIRIHALARSLGIQKAAVVGHDIGLMVAYAYAAQLPAEVEKLVVMDAFLPGVGEWEAIYNNPGFWHFRFNGPTPEALVQGRERIYFEHYWNDFAADKTNSVPEADRRAYTAAYSPPDACAPAGLTSSPSSRPQRISPSSLKLN